MGGPAVASHCDTCVRREIEKEREAVMWPSPRSSADADDDCGGPINRSLVSRARDVCLSSSFFFLSLSLSPSVRVRACVRSYKYYRSRD